MEVVLAYVVGALVTLAVLLLLRRSLVSVVVGLLVLGNAVNLLIMTMGRLTRAAPPLVEAGAVLPEEPFANPLPQAFVLTAIVINFGLLAFSLVLTASARAIAGTVDPHELAGPEDTPPARVGGAA